MITLKKIILMKQPLKIPDRQNPQTKILNMNKDMMNLCKNQKSFLKIKLNQMRFLIIIIVKAQEQSKWEALAML